MLLIICEIFLALVVRPALWVASTLIQQWLLLLALTIAHRAARTVLVQLLPHGNWWRSRRLMPVQPNQLVLITGATSGIGLALAKHLYKLGYSVAACYFRPEPGMAELKRLASETGHATGGNRARQAGGRRAQGQNHMFLLEMDVRKAESIGEAYKRVELLLEEHKLELFGIVNNAGLGSLQPFAWLQRNVIKNMIETNLTGNLLVAREFLPLLVKRANAKGRAQASRMLFVSSGLGFVPGATHATYGTTKAAQLYLVRSLNLDLKPRFNVQSVAVVPHNFIKITNICSNNVEQNQRALDELKPLERQLYGPEFREHCAQARSLEEATKRHISLAQKQQKSSGLATLMGQIVASIKGENTASSVEESGALDAFELALRLVEPPEVVFAGDTMFQLLTGSLLLTWPSSLSGLLSASVGPSLYR